MPPCWVVLFLTPRVQSCWNWRNGRPSIVPSIIHPSRRQNHPHYDRQSTGLPSLGALSGAGVMANPGRWCCGKGCNISPISPRCTVLCALSPRSKKMWVKLRLPQARRRAAKAHSLLTPSSSGKGRPPLRGACLHVQPALGVSSVGPTALQLRPDLTAGPWCPHLSLGTFDPSTP
jgi:hypothetical protein